MNTVSVRSWNYRVIEFVQGEERWRAIHEVHYDRGVPKSYSEGPALVLWDVAEGDSAARSILERMREALEKPTLRETDFTGINDADKGACADDLDAP